MGFDLHTISMPNGAGPYRQDKLDIASFVNIPFPAAASAAGTTGAITAGSGYTFTPTLTVSGGTLTAASAAGVAPVVAVGTTALMHATMKVISAGVTAGGSGWATSDTVLLANGVELTVTASAGAIASLAVTTAGLISQPGPLPSTGVQVLSTSGSGIGAVLTLSWGIAGVVMDDSGSYSSFSGTTVTVASVDGNGTSGAVAGPLVAVAANKCVFKQLACGGPPAPNMGAAITASPLLIANPGLAARVVAKINGFITVGVEPVTATSSTTAGTFDALLWS